jgi:uracil phosphoribosyltransferase
MTIHDLSLKNSVLNNFILEIRDKKIQLDAMRFRRNIERIGEILCYELSKELYYESRNVQTPLGHKEIDIVKNELVLCSVLRAGLPLHQGILNYFDQIDNAFISAYRQPDSQGGSEIKVDYFASPSLDKKYLLLADPMLATGNSLIAVYDTIKKIGELKQIHIVAVIAATKGIESIKKHFPKNTHLWVATIDDKLNEKGYIIPGLGDAGDLAFGQKL